MTRGARHPSPPRVPRVLSIAGSDSGGGAGIQADLKAFARCGVHGMTAVTAITAQNTVGVAAVHQVPPDIVQAQVRAISEDIGVDAVKVGMLGDADTVRAVAEALAGLPTGTPVVVDPVMVAESGARLLEPDAESALAQILLPLAIVATPNRSEARVLATFAPALSAVGAPGVPGPGPEADPFQLARAVRSVGPEIVVVTGGDADNGADVFFDGGEPVSIGGERYPSAAAHGSGCTHSSVLAALLAWGRSPLEAARGARRLAGAAVRDGLASIGAGAGPVDVLGLAGEEPNAKPGDGRLS